MHTFVRLYTCVRKLVNIIFTTWIEHFIFNTFNFAHWIYTWTRHVSVCVLFIFWCFAFRMHDHTVYKAHISINLFSFLSRSRSLSSSISQLQIFFLTRQFKICQLSSISNILLTIKRFRFHFLWLLSEPP